jgi:type VI secretion system Hcp family effector
MAMNAFLQIPGAPGSARQKHVRNWIVVHGVHGGTALEPPAEGKLFEYAPSRHQCLVIRKDIDQASPRLFEFLHAAKKVGVVTLDFWQMPLRGGREEIFYSMALAGVQITRIRTLLLHVRRPEHTLLPEQEEVSLVFDSIVHRANSDGAEGRQFELKTTTFALPEWQQFQQAAGAAVKAAAVAFKDQWRAQLPELFAATDPMAPKAPETPK